MNETVRYMLDTNIASYIICGGNKKLRKCLSQISISSLCISSVTQAELIYGIELKPEATTLKKLVYDFLLRPEILPWDDKATEQYGTVRARLEKSGAPIRNLDTMIAAHALSINAVLVTNDQAFKRVEGLRIEDWS